MRTALTGVCILLGAATAFADDVSTSGKLLCSASKVMLCFEDGMCTEAAPWELDIPQFVVIDSKKKIVSTTRASGENRTTAIRTMHREAGELFLQGTEGGRAFSFVIDQATGLLTAAISSDGATTSVFGACTDAEKL